MLVFLFVLLVVLTYTVYKVFGDDLLTPTVWFLIGWDFSVLFALTKLPEWGDISGKSVFIVLLGAVSFILGGIVGQNFKIYKRRKISHEVIREVSNSRLICSPVFLFISLFILLYTVYVDYRFVLSAALYGGYSGGSNLLTFARSSMLTDVTMPYSIYIPIALSQACAYVITHSIITDLISSAEERKRKNYWLLKAICIFLFSIIAFLSTGRTMIMYFLLFILADVCIQLTLVYGRSRRINKSIIKYGLLTVSVILVLFVLVDVYFRASKYGIERNPLDQIIKYTSSSLYAFDLYLKKPTSAADTGYETLYNVYSILRRLGFNYEKTSNTLPFANFSNVSTNVYTALRRYIHDFGYVGMVIIQFLIGIIYESAYKKIKYGNASSFFVILYCTFIFAPVFNCIEERFIINVLSLRSLMIVAFIYSILHFVNRFSFTNKMKI